MRHCKTAGIRRQFKTVVATAQAQGAMMTLTSGGASDDEPSNEHPRAEQWLYVISGSGIAKIGRSRRRLRSVRLAEGSLLVIERGELHQIRQTGRRPLRTLNFYVPPAYDADGEVRPAVE